MFRNWWSTKYKVAVIYSLETEQELYRWNEWQKFIPEIDKLLKLSDKPAHIRSGQTKNNKGSWLGFGSMPWNLESNEKWCTKYLEQEEKIEFYYTQVWAPDWNYVEKNKKPVDIYVQLSNGLFDKYQCFILAIKESLFEENANLIEQTAGNIASLMHGAQIKYLERKWAKTGLLGLSFENPLDNASLFTLIPKNC